MTHHQPAHGEQNAEEGFQCPQAVLCPTLSLQSSHRHQYGQSPLNSEKINVLQQSSAYASLVHNKLILQATGAGTLAKA